MKFFPFLILLILGSLATKAQLQPGECGLKFSYDATGSLIKREYICNNGTGIMNRKGAGIFDNGIAKESEENTEVIALNAIMPNPTTGKFIVSLTSPLNNATVSLLSAGGSVLEKKKHSGNSLSFDVSNYASGTYYVRIEQGAAIVTFKVIKR